MIHCKYNEQTEKAKLEVNGSLGVIYAEIGLVVLDITRYKELEMTVDDVLGMVKESIEQNLKVYGETK